MDREDTDLTYYGNDNTNKVSIIERNVVEYHYEEQRRIQCILVISNFATSHQTEVKDDQDLVVGEVKLANFGHAKG